MKAVSALLVVLGAVFVGADLRDLFYATDGKDRDPDADALNARGP